MVTHLGELFCKNCSARLSSSTNHENKAVPHSFATLALSTEGSLNCCSCGKENSISNVSPNRKQHYQSNACRLRGGGSEIEGTNNCLEEKKYFLENECANIGNANSMTTVCDPPPSPTAVTAWYNRQHSKYRRFEVL